MILRSSARIAGLGLVGGLSLAAAGCQTLLNQTDKQVYAVIERRQSEAIGMTPDLRIAPASEPVRPGQEAYRFVPSPLSPEVPADFTQAPATQPAPATQTRPVVVANYATPRSTGPAAETQPATERTTRTDGFFESAATQPDPNALRFNLPDSLRYAFHDARELQTAKEDLYLSGLALTLERYLWTPRWVSTIQTDFTGKGKGFPEAQGFDRAMNAVADVAVQQNLPYGGAVTARVVDTLISNLRQGVTETERGTAGVDAVLPLLRGAGPAAYESRYQAERNLIYAVRAFEQFRRGFAVEIASDYFRLLELKQRIVNAQKGVESFHTTYLRAKALFDAGRVIALDVQRAEQEELIARNQVIDATEQYQLALDEFKLKLGMPMEQPLEIVEELIDFPLPQAGQERAIEVALQTRLDLINTRDQIDDARRKVAVARNDLLPGLDLRAGVDVDTQPGKLDAWDYRGDRNDWTAGVVLDLPLDRKAETNTFRRRYIELHRAQRAHEAFADRVRLQVRQAIRRIEQSRFSLDIQKLNMELAERRRAYAEIRFQQGALSNRDVVEAENALLAARNRFATAQADLRRAILEFRLNTGTLRVGDDGTLLEAPQPGEVGGADPRVVSTQ